MENTSRNTAVGGYKLIMSNRQWWSLRLGLARDYSSIYWSFINYLPASRFTAFCVHLSLPFYNANVLVFGKDICVCKNFNFQFSYKFCLLFTDARIGKSVIALKGVCGDFKGKKHSVIPWVDKTINQLSLRRKI